MYDLWDAKSSFAVGYFTILIILGAFCLLNLTLAVMYDNFKRKKTEVRERPERELRHMGKYQSICIWAPSMIQHRFLRHSTRQAMKLISQTKTLNQEWPTILAQKVDVLVFKDIKFSYARPLCPYALDMP